MKILKEIKRKVDEKLNNMSCLNFICKGFTFSEILDRVQASEEEIQRGLEHYECVEVGGRWFILDQDYQMVVLSRILK